MTGQRRRSDAHSPILHPRADRTPHVATHVGAGVVIRVIKIGGRAQGDPTLPERLRDAASARGTRLVIVHGGGDEVTALQRRMGVEPQFVNGRRVTSPADLDAVRMILSGTVNKRLVAQLATTGMRSVGVSGEDGGMLSARVTDSTFGRVGGDVFADATLVADLLNGGWIPVISPLARDRESAEGDGLNVNGDDAAAAIAARAARWMAMPVGISPKSSGRTRATACVSGSQAAAACTSGGNWSAGKNTPQTSTMGVMKSVK